MFVKDRSIPLPVAPGVSALLCLAILLAPGAAAQAAEPALSKEDASPPCVIRPVMTEAEIDACRKPEKKSAASGSDVGPKAAVADDSPLARVSARPPLTCEYKPVMTDAEIDACRRH